MCAEKLGGSLNLESEVDVGTSIKVRIPLAGKLPPGLSANAVDPVSETAQSVAGI